MAAPDITGDKASLERGEQIQQATACLIVARAKGIGNDSYSLGVKGIPKPMAIIFDANVGSLSSQTSATSSSTTFSEVNLP